MIAWGAFLGARSDALRRAAAGLALLTSTWLGYVGCSGDDTSTGTGGGAGAASGGGGAGTAGETASGGTTSTAIGGSGGGGATGGSGGSGDPCTPLSEADDPNPTPGSCQGNVAITCSQEGWLTAEICVEGNECREYALDEWRFDGDPSDPAWVTGRTVTWAGCLPTGAESCPLIWNGDYYTFQDAPYCDGQNRVACRLPPRPDLWDGYPQLQYGTETGWLEVLACPSDERCAGSGTLNELTCIANDTPACDGSEPFCANDGIVWCYGTWESLPGYQHTELCTLDTVCYEGTTSPFCRTPGEVPCDDASFVTQCEGATSIVSCYEGYTSHASCAPCYDDLGEPIDCRCDEVIEPSGWSWDPTEGLLCTDSSYPSCVPQASPDCDPATDADSCVGDVAHRCLGHWEEVDCAASGRICDVASGIAGCREATAPACAPGAPAACDGTEIVSCCGCGTVFMPWASMIEPCVPSYEVRADCADLGPAYSCHLTGGVFAECY